MKRENKHNEKRKSPFSVPDNYFEDFSAKINTKIQREDSADNTDASSSKSIVQLLKPALLMVASFAIIFSLVYLPVKSYLDNNKNLDSQRLVSKQEMIEINEQPEYEEDINEELLIDYITQNTTDYELYRELYNNDNND